MTPERWLRIKEILDAAWQREAAGRAAFLEQACADDPELRAEVEALLVSDENAGDFLAALALDQAGTGLQSLLAADPSGDDEGSELIGTRVGRYSITGLIGKGGMGAVYRAVREDDFRMQVAIKLLKRGTDTEAALDRFRAERQILAGLQHPNIARLLDGGATETGLPYFVMEYVDGTPLLEYAAPLPVRQRVELFRAVCLAVEYAHRNRIVHRDIKPANLLVTREGMPKLLDFGIAKLLDPAGDGSMMTLTAAGARPMTPSYASPEQVRGESVTTASDIFSLGAVLYELLTGQRAHPAESHTPNKPSAAAKDVDPDLDNIVLMALRKEPERRYASAEEFSADLDRFLHNLPVHARKESLPYRGRKFLKRNRVPAITAAVSTVIVLALVAGVGRLNRAGVATDAAARSIAVLPLENLSGDPEQEYFAEGLTDALINNLAQVQGLRVISRTSSSSFKGERRPLPEIARSLGVQTIAEGSVLRSGTRVRLSVRLIDAPKDRPIWSGSYEGELRDVLGLQRQVALAIAGKIHVTLTGPNRSRGSYDRQVDLAAYDAYLKGRHQNLAEFTQESNEKAIAYYRQALAIDPSYAPAYAGLAGSYYLLSNIYLPPTEVMPKSKAAALKALEIDDTLGEAHAMLALVRSLYEFDRVQAEMGFRRAIELKPSDAETHLWYGLHLITMSRFQEAISEVEQAQKLDPVSPGMNVYIGYTLFLAHRYDDAIQRLQPMLDSDPNYHQTHAFLALAYEQKGEWAKAIAEMERAYELDKEPEALAQLGHIYAMAGRTADARKVLAQLMKLSRQRYVSTYNIALVHAGLGERDEAFRWLQTVEKDRSEWFAQINVDPRFDVLHSDPRFTDLLRIVGLAH